MKKSVYCFLLLTMLIAGGCNSIKFKFPLGVKKLVSCIPNEAMPYGWDCACLVDDLRDDLPASIWPVHICNNVIGADPGYYQELETWFDDKIKRLEICVNHPKQCQ